MTFDELLPTAHPLNSIDVGYWALKEYWSHRAGQVSLRHLPTHYHTQSLCLSSEPVQYVPRCPKADPAHLYVFIYLFIWSLFLLLCQWHQRTYTFYVKQRRLTMECSLFSTTVSLSSYARPKLILHSSSSVRWRSGFSPLLNSISSLFLQLSITKPNFVTHIMMRNWRRSLTCTVLSILCACLNSHSNVPSITCLMLCFFIQ